MREHRLRLAAYAAVLFTCLLAASVRAESADKPGKRDSYEQHYGLGNQLLERGKYAAALKEFRAAYALNQNTAAAAIFQMGVCYQRMGNYSEAVGYYALYLNKELKPHEAILKELEGLLAQMKAITEDVQGKKQEVLNRLCAFSLASPNCKKSAALRPVVVAEPSAVTSTATGGVAQPVLSPAPDSASSIGPTASSVNDSLSDRPTEKPIYRKGWFWGAVAGGVVVAGIVIGVGVYAGTRPKNVPDPAGIAVLGLQ